MNNEERDGPYFLHFFFAHNTPVWPELHAWKSVLKIISRVDAFMYIRDQMKNLHFLVILEELINTYEMPILFWFMEQSSLF